MNNIVSLTQFPRFLFLAAVLALGSPPAEAQDTTPPRLVAATSATGFDITVQFNEAMSLLGLNSALNYQVSSGGATRAISGVTSWPGNTSVVVTLSAMLPPSSSFTVAVQGVKDIARNSIAAGASITGRVWDSPLALSTIGDAPNPVSEALAVSEGHLILRGGGKLFYGANASFLFPHQTRTNDFDVQVRVDSLVKTATRRE